MNNYIQPGDVLEVTAPSGGVASGQAIQVGQIVGIATTAAAEGARVNLKLTGVFDVPKAEGETWDEGELIHFDAVAEKFTVVAADNLRVGIAAAAAGSSATVGRVRLDGVGRPNESTGS